ncbi:MAG TPA: flagellar motor switch protein FliG [Candidatus Latescibacteria bacterium]|nr:flagellar motor switch protein FliG [Candidatus Latescibacterota bacterium]
MGEFLDQPTAERVARQIATRATSAKKISSADELTGMQKAAILMLALGVEASATLYRELAEEEIEQLSKEIAALPLVDSSIVRTVIEEFFHMIRAQEYITTGGMEYAKEILQKALGEQKALEIIKRIQMALQVRGFNVLKEIDPNQLISFIQKEHPQTIAMVLTQLEPTRAAAVLDGLRDDLRSEVIYRYATMDRVSQGVISAVERVLESSVDLTLQSGQFGGVKAAADILNMMGQSVERKVLEDLRKKDPELAEQVKDLMFVFEDIVLLDDRDLQEIIRSVDTRTLALALKGAGDDVRKKVLENLSERARAMVEEEMEYLGAVRLKEVEEAQRQIIEVIRQMEEEGKIVIERGREEYVV